ncbi:bifunctional SulP family inorganic anion transporter/carbonic anhydrase [Crateriforma spongiae]|uniref:bifunctional SulP family inorganic anion transporter/carbonic anhydrase n=1 Tax=Crateriforma spongiae TaxID=2724528 RepID=UPI0014459425|nr:carbonic anhydrase family protein [Crateriforma spongiae]
MKLRDDLPASISVFLVALPLCLGIALASSSEAVPVPLMSGLIAGIIGGIVVGSISGSHTSVSGPAAGLVAIVIAQTEALGSFEAFVLAVSLAGVIQVFLGAMRAGVIAYYFPSSVIRGLLTAIGVILILKQLPHAVGYDRDAEGDFSFFQADGYNTFTELGHMFEAFSVTATVISLGCLCILIFWEKRFSGKTPIPGPLVAVVVGTLINELVGLIAPDYALGASHRVQLSGGADSSSGLFTFPDFSALQDPQLYLAAVTIALVASLETLLNLEAVDRLDTLKRVSPANRELYAQGIGNICSGLIGGLPVTSVIVRSSANVYSGAKSKASTIMHGIWLGGTVFTIPWLLEQIPLSALAAILLFTGYKLAKPAIFMDAWNKGWNQFLPFALTVLAIVFTDLLIGIVIGLIVGVIFVLRSMERTPFLSEQENPVTGNVTRLKFGQHLTFLNQSRVRKTLDKFAEGSHLILDASKTEYIDPDVLDTIRDFRDVKAPAKKIDVSFVGFRDRYALEDRKGYSDVVTRAKQAELTPLETLNLLRRGNERFLSGEMLERDWSHQRDQTSEAQHPMAALLGCIDSRVPAELVFDVGIGDIFSVRVAGNVVNEDVLGSLEYAAEVGEVNLIVVLGHTRCGAVTAACQGVKLGHVTELIEKISPIAQNVRSHHTGEEDAEFVDQVAKQNVLHVIDEIIRRSEIVANLIKEGKVDIVGGMYHLKEGRVEFFGGMIERLSDTAAT